MSFLPELSQLVAHAGKTSVFIAAIFLLRLALKRLHPGAWIFDLLWIAVVLRLLFPALPLSPVSAYGWWAPTEANVALTAPEQPFRITYLDGPAPVVPREPLRAATSQPPGTSSVSSASFDLAPLVLVWLVGMILGLEFWIAQSLRIRFQQRPLPDAPFIVEAHRQATESLGLRRIPEPRLCSAIASPILFGIFRPRVLLPPQLSEDLSEEEWKHVFLHELAHRRRLDPLWHTLHLLACFANWFNPLAWLSLKLASHDRELASDDLALRHQSSRHAYGSTLLKIVALISNRHRSRLTLAFFSQPQSTLNQRIQMIANHPARPRHLQTLLGVAALLATLFLLGADPLVRAQDDPFPGDEPTPMSTDEKVRKIIMPSVEFVDTPIQDAIQFLVARSRELDTSSNDPQEKGINIILKEPSDARITLKLTNVPLGEALNYTAQLASLSYHVEDNAVVIDKIDAKPKAAKPLALHASAEIYSLPKLAVLKLLDQYGDEAKNDGTALREAVIKAVSEENGDILSSPTVVCQSGQRAKIASGRDVQLITNYEAEGDRDKPVLKTVFSGVLFELDPVIDSSETLVDLNFRISHSLAPEITPRTIPGPASGEDREIQLYSINESQITSSITMESGTTRLIGVTDSPDLTTDETLLFFLKVAIR